MHFYRQTEDFQILPYHFVPMSSKPNELRPTRLNDVRKLWKEGEIVCPSVTTVLNVLSKPGLESWKVDQHLSVAFKNFGKIYAFSNDWSKDAWIDRVKVLTEREMDKAPQAGTDIHKSLEAYFTGQLPADSPDYKLCADVHDQVNSATDCYSWITEKNFICDLGYGGQVDLHNEDWVIDFKSKQSKDKFKPGKMVYQEHSMQLAAYREGLGIPQARCANVFVSLEDGQVDFHEHSPEQLETGWMMFYHALRLWQVQNGAPQ